MISVRNIATGLLISPVIALGLLSGAAHSADAATMSATSHSKPSAHPDDWGKRGWGGHYRPYRHYGRYWPYRHYRHYGHRWPYKWPYRHYGQGPWY